MEGFVYVVVWVAVMILIMRYGCGMGHRHHAAERGQAVSRPGNGSLRWIAPATDVDPVCGKTVHTAEAKSAVHGGTVYYFCSRDCREVFEAAPDTYLRHETSRAVPGPEHVHG